jgi:pilus assembly protein CpaB
MSGRTILMVLLALVFGSTAAIGVVQLTRKPPQAMAAPETVGVVVAAKDVPRFTTLTADMLHVQQFPKDMAPPGCASRIEEVIDRVYDSHLVKDEPVMEAKLSPKGSGRGMPSVIPMGMRAVTIRTPNVATGVAGFILPGSRVDVLCTLRSNGQQDDETGGGMTTTLLQNVEIIAVDQRIEAPSENKVDIKELRSVTLLLTPDQANTIELAHNAGTLTLILRHYQDTESVVTGPATLANIKGEKPRAPARDTTLDDRLKEMLEKGSKLLATLEASAKDRKEQAPVAVAPPPTPKPEVPAAPPKIRTLRSGIPGQVLID